MTSKRATLEACLRRARDPDGEGLRVFSRLYEHAAQLSAETADSMERLGLEAAPLAGLPVSIKDLFDVRGEPTLAGSRVLASARPAARDAEVVRRLRQAGAAVIGKTNMTEFAFSGLGINPHYGTPLNAWDRASRRIPGGSSSGAAISVTDGMALAAIGTDTGGSCRIPAAFNGIVGMKSSARSVPTSGVLPLAASFDSVGALASTVETCAAVYNVLAGLPPSAHARISLQSLRIGSVINSYVLDEMDDVVSTTYGKAISRLAEAGVAVRDMELNVLDRLPPLFANGGIVAAEAYQWHRELLEASESEYDPRVAVRVKRGGLSSAAEYIGLLKLRQELIGQWYAEISAYDAIIMPTVPIVAPRFDDIEDDESYGRLNMLVLRNPTLVNALDGCAISIPCHTRGDPPVGLMIVSAGGTDQRLLAIAAAIEPLFL